MSADLRRCKWCKLILNPAASGETGPGRSVQPHCGAQSSKCDWCQPCFARRTQMLNHGLNPDTGNPIIGEH